MGKKQNIDIILLQETHVYQAGVERRKEYTIFFSETEQLKDDAGKQKNVTHAGVAIMIRNKMKLVKHSELANDLIVRYFSFNLDFIFNFIYINVTLVFENKHYSA